MKRESLIRKAVLWFCLIFDVFGWFLVKGTCFLVYVINHPFLFYLLVFFFKLKSEKQKEKMKNWEPRGMALYLHVSVYFKTDKCTH